MRSSTAVRRRRAEPTVIEETTGERSRRSEPLWWAWLDLNQRPHPYQRSTADRHANQHCPRPYETCHRDGVNQVPVGRSWRLAISPDDSLLVSLCLAGLCFSNTGLLSGRVICPCLVAAARDALNNRSSEVEGGYDPSQCREVVEERSRDSSAIFGTPAWFCLACTC